MNPTTPPPGLARKRAAARAALWFEQLWPAIWPALGLLGAFAVIALLDLPALLPPWPRLALPILTLLATTALLVHRLRRIARPAPADADRRLEHASGLKHRPLAALQDRPAAATPESARIWTVHQDRLRAQLRRLRIGRPRPGLARHDPRALRALVLIALAAALAIAGPQAPGRLLAAAFPGLPPGPPTPGTVVQAWITPPPTPASPPSSSYPANPPPPFLWAPTSPSASPAAAPPPP